MGTPSGMAKNFHVSQYYLRPVGLEMKSAFPRSKHESEPCPLSLEKDMFLPNDWVKNRKANVSVTKAVRHNKNDTFTCLVG